MEESQVLVDCGPGGITPDALRIVWDPSPALPLETCAAARLENRWQAALTDARAAGKTLFDGPITRLLSATGATDAQNVTLHVGPGSYRAFLITRLRDRAWFEAHAPEACTHALGNSVLLTHAGTALLGIRSRNVSCYAGRAHLIGGVLETLGTPQFPASPAGLIAHLLLELHEEAGITPADLLSRGAWPRLLGVYQDNVLGQPEAIWQWETFTPLEVLARQLAAAEHDGHCLVERGALNADPRAPFTPLARRALAAWAR